LPTLAAGALGCYQAALQLRPNFPQGLNNLAVILTAQGRAAEAGQMLQAAIAAAPGYAEAHNNLGVLQRELGAIQVTHSFLLLEHRSAVMEFEPEQLTRKLYRLCCKPSTKAPCALVGLAATPPRCCRAQHAQRARPRGCNICQP
jgi:tetratricopeptide (TPR) repeat protein